MLFTHTQTGREFVAGFFTFALGKNLKIITPNLKERGMRIDYHEGTKPSFEMAMFLPPRSP